MKKELVVDYRMNATNKFITFQERLSIVGCLFELYAVCLRNILFKLVQKVFADVANDLQQLVDSFSLLHLHVLKVVIF